MTEKQIQPADLDSSYTPDEEELHKEPTPVMIEPKAVEKRMGAARSQRLNEVKKKISQGKWIPKAVFRPGPAIVAAPAWEDPDILAGEDDGRQVKARQPAYDNAGASNIIHGADLNSPLFQDRGADQQAEVNQSWWWWLTADGRPLLADHLRFKLRMYGILVKTAFMALFWIPASRDYTEQRLVGYAPTSGLARPASYDHFYAPNEYIVRLPIRLRRWWRFGLNLKNQFWSAYRLSQHKHVGGWRRLLSMLWRRRYPQVPVEKVLPQAWDKFKTATREGEPAYLASPPQPKLTLNGISLQDLIDAASTLGMPASAVAGPWLILCNIMDSMPTREHIVKMATALGEATPSWIEELAAYSGKIAADFLSPRFPGTFLKMPTGYPQEAMQQFQELTTRYQELIRNQLADRDLFNMLDRARFAEAATPGYFAGFSTEEVERTYTDYRTDAPAYFMAFKDERAQEFVASWGYSYRTAPSETAALTVLAEFKRLGMSEKIVEKALTTYRRSVKR